MSYRQKPDWNTMYSLRFAGHKGLEIYRYTLLRDSLRHVSGRIVFVNCYYVFVYTYIWELFNSFIIEYIRAPPSNEGANSHMIYKGNRDHLPRP